MALVVVTVYQSLFKGVLKKVYLQHLDILLPHQNDIYKTISCNHIFLFCVEVIALNSFSSGVYLVAFLADGLNLQYTALMQ